jgi:hypothetical protein
MVNIFYSGYEKVKRIFGSDSQPGNNHRNVSGPGYKQRHQEELEAFDESEEDCIDLMADGIL